jgi:predicted CXXCH cytochrome family protein
VPFFAALEGDGVASRHSPVAEGACAACHDLHGGMNPQLLKNGARGTVCRGCHRNPAGAHHLFPVAELEAAKGGAGATRDECTHCHDPHASSQRKLLPAPSDGVCQGCHTH